MIRIESGSSSSRVVLSALVALIVGTMGATALATDALARESKPGLKVGPGVYLAPVSGLGGEVDAATERRRSLPRKLLSATPQIVGGEERIVGGQQTTIGQWPWQVAITANSGIFVGNGFERQICGGTLVTPKLVVTAAHCFFDSLQSSVDGFDDLSFDEPGYFAAITGRSQLSSSAGQETDVDAYYYPTDGGGLPLYNPSTEEWDVVIVELASSSTSQTIKIAGPDEGALWEPGRAAYITGWGLTSEGGTGSDFLRQAEVEMISDSTCGSPGSYGAEFIAETMVCAGLLEGGRDTCQGDSGGPLVAPTAAGGFRLVGDTSWGIGCAQPNLPGVYGRLADDPIRTSLGNGIQSIAGVDVIGSGAQPPDTTPPDTTITSGPTGTTSNASPSFGFSSSEAGSTFECSLDSEAFTACLSPKSYSSLPVGAHDFKVRATDAAGNTDPTPASRDFTVDTTAYKAKISRVKVSGPGKVKRKKKATYKVKITNSGNAQADGVKLKISGKGVKSRKSVGKIGAKKTRTFKVKLKFKKPGKVKAKFKVTSTNAGGKTVKKKITVKR